MNALPRRRTPAKGVHVDPDQPTLLWVTVCSKDRVEWLAQERVMRLLHSVWLKEATAWLVGDYLLMPDHVHFFCGLRDSGFTVERWVAFWKHRFARRHCEEAWIWQKGSFHHRVRSVQEYREKWTYMMENPVRKELVSQWEDWRWRGRVHGLPW